MKKLLCLFLINCFLLSFPALAAQQNAPIDFSPFEDVPVDESTYQEQPPAPPAPRLSDGRPGTGAITDIDKYWTQNGFPSDVSFAHEAGGELLDDGTILSYWEIGLVGADEARKTEILSLLDPTCLVTFIDCDFPYAQRQAAHDALLARGDPNIRQVVVIRNTQEVWVEVPGDLVADYAAQLEPEFGAMVVVAGPHQFAYTEGINHVLPGLGFDQGLGQAENAAQESASPVPFWPLFLLLALLAVGIALLLRRARLSAAVQTAAGPVVTHSRPSRRAVEQAVRESAESPGDGLYSSILYRIRQ